MRREDIGLTAAPKIGEIYRKIHTENNNLPEERLMRGVKLIKQGGH